MCYESTPYYTITPESMFRERNRLYEKARHDEAQALQHARQEGKAEGRAEGRAAGRAEGIAEGEASNKKKIARTMLADGMPMELIVKYTNLTPEEIEALR